MQHAKLNVSRETSKKIDRYIELLLSWNKKINLISKHTEDDVLERHIIDSIQLSKFISTNTQELPSEVDGLMEGKKLDTSGSANQLTKKRILDFGTGAGLPGIVLNIAGFNNITLVESIKKKCDFLEFVKKDLNLTANIVNDRVENIDNCNFDIITARAVASLDKLFNLIAPLCKKNTKCLFLKGKKYKEEINNAEKLWKFKYKRYTSITSDESVILEITNIKSR